LTRDPSSEHAKELAGLGSSVELVVGAPTDDEALRNVFTGAQYAFVNLNSFALGIKNELYWGIRAYELAVQCGIKHYIWSSLDDHGPETNFDDALRCGHYYGKAHVKQWMSALPQSPMKWTVICTGPYIEQLWYFQLPKKLESGEYDFRLPIGDGALTYVCLDDMGYFTRWVFEHPERSAGLNLRVGVEHVSLKHLAKTFTAVTGKPARATALSIEDWFVENGLMEGTAQHKIGSSTAAEDDPSLLTFYDNFAAWWRLYQRSADNKGLLRKDYALLDEIHPGRTRTLKQWMERVGYNGDESRTFEKTRPWDG
jgi:hypothetical protein